MTAEDYDHLAENHLLDLHDTVGLKGNHGKKNVTAVLSMGFFEDNLP